MPRSALAVPTAQPFVPETLELDALEEASRACQGCPLFRDATQTVFGDGPRDASLFLVGEQPGDKEDLQGQPFVGPAGGVLRKALDELGVDAEQAYVTNAVKHFSFEQRGKRRIHRTPSLTDLVACKPWLTAELEAVQPEVVVCLGATAVRSVLGTGIKVMRDRGRVLTGEESAGLPAAVVTIHPSAVLRATDRGVAYRGMVDDLRVAVELLAG